MYAVNHHAQQFRTGVCGLVAWGKERSKCEQSMRVSKKQFSAITSIYNTWCQVKNHEALIGKEITLNCISILCTLSILSRVYYLVRSCYIQHVSVSFLSFPQYTIHKSSISRISGEVAKFSGFQFGTFTVNKSCEQDIFFTLVTMYRALLQHVISRCFPTHTQERRGKHREIGWWLVRSGTGNLALLAFYPSKRLSNTESHLANIDILKLESCVGEKCRSGLEMSKLGAGQTWALCELDTEWTLNLAWTHSMWANVSKQ